MLLSNVNIGNNDPSAFLQLVSVEQPDIVIVQEGNVAWLSKVKTFPYQMASSESGVFGTVIFSHLPFEQTQILLLGSGGLESLLVKFQVKGKMVSLLATHPWPPINQEAFDYRNSQLFEVSAFFKQLSMPKMIVGDLNISMWSPIYYQMIQDMYNARQGFGILPTWPTFLPLIPIDHCLVGY